MSSMTRSEILPNLSVPSLRGLVATWRAAQATRREHNRIVRELEAYSDRDLLELGLFRHDIRDVAAGTYRR